MTRSVAAALVVLTVYSRAGVTPPPAAAASGLAGPLQPFAFLLGNWRASPGPAGETGAFSFTAEVQGQAVVRKNYADYPASEGKPASRHDDLMVMAVEHGAVQAAYYDNEGHVIHYRVTAPRPREARFESEPTPNEPRYRLRYTLGDDGVLAGAFDVAATATPNAFVPYLTWTARRQ